MRCQLEIRCHGQHGWLSDLAVQVRRGSTDLREESRSSPRNRVFMVEAGDTLEVTVSFSASDDRRPTTPAPGTAFNLAGVLQVDGSGTARFVAARRGYDGPLFGRAHLAQVQGAATSSAGGQRIGARIAIDVNLSFVDVTPLLIRRLTTQPDPHQRVATQPDPRPRATRQRILPPALRDSFQRLFSTLGLQQLKYISTLEGLVPEEQ